MIRFIKNIEVSEYTNENSFIQDGKNLYFVAEELSSSEYLGVELIENGHNSYDIRACFFVTEDDMRTIKEIHRNLTINGAESAYRDFFRYLNYDSEIEISEKILPVILPFVEDGDYEPYANKFKWNFLEIFEFSGEVFPGFYNGVLKLTDASIINSTNNIPIKTYKDMTISSNFYIDEYEDEYGNILEQAVEEIELYLESLNQKEALYIVKKVIEM